MVPPTTESVAEPVAVVELVSGVPIGAFARVAVKFVISGPASLSLQFPKAITAAMVNPPNTTCLRMNASRTPRGERRTARTSLYAYPPDGACQATISNRNSSCHSWIPSPGGSSPPDPLSLRERGHDGGNKFPLSRRERG